MIKLTKQEKNFLRIFLLNNKEWIKTNSLNKEENINYFINLYGKFLEENHLMYSRTLQMFLVILHQEAAKAKMNKYSMRLQKLNINNIPFDTKLSNNPIINAWMEAADFGVEKNKQSEETIDYLELDRRITEQREKQILKIRRQNGTK